MKRSSENRNFSKLIIPILLIVFGIFLLTRGLSGVMDSEKYLKAPSGKIMLEILDTAPKRQMGLSGRESISENNGMLFVFDNVSTDNCFWMRDMKFPIDMIWMDEQKKVITMHSNVTPDTYPTSFCPERPARYGLELSAGQAQKLEISVGSALQFNY